VVRRAYAACSTGALFALDCDPTSICSILLRPRRVDSGMLGTSLILKAAKKGKQKFGWKGFVAAGALAFFGQRALKKRLKGGSSKKKQKA